MVLKIIILISTQMVLLSLIPTL